MTRRISHELEVSKRTIYRDIDALSVAGVPVYASGGPAVATLCWIVIVLLLPDWMNTNSGTVYADHPSPISDLGVSQQLKAAILKLTVRLRVIAMTCWLPSSTFAFDAASWFQIDEPVPHLKSSKRQRGKIANCSSYRRRNGTVSERTISPYGLVAKASIWYLVAATDKGCTCIGYLVLKLFKYPEHFARPKILISQVLGRLGDRLQG